MARAATTADAFNAIAEPRRRQIVDLLAVDEGRSVGELVDALRLPQPTVSKHLAVLRKVGLVTVSRRGQHRFYQLNAKDLKAVYEWVQTFERFWDGQLGRIKERAERAANDVASRAGGQPQSSKTSPKKKGE